MIPSTGSRSNLISSLSLSFLLGLEVEEDLEKRRRGLQGDGAEEVKSYKLKYLL